MPGACLLGLKALDERPWTQGLLHYRTCKSCQCTGRMYANVPENLVVCWLAVRFEGQCWCRSVRLKWAGTAAWDVEAQELAKQWPDQPLTASPSTLRPSLPPSIAWMHCASCWSALRPMRGQTAGGGPGNITTKSALALLHAI